jgi:hypothetical protein
MTADGKSRATQYVYGFDPTHGDDIGVEVVFEKMPYGKLRLISFGRVLEDDITVEENETPEMRAMMKRLFTERLPAKKAGKDPASEAPVQ